MTAKNEATKPCKRCGVLIPDRANGLYCRACSIVLRAEYMVRYRQEGARTPRKGFEEKSTVCICPMCKKLHKRIMNWTGKGIPHFYCKSCLNVDAVQYLDVSYELQLRA